MPKLTKRYVDGLDPDARDYFQWDADLPGFGIRIWPTGRKVYIAQYRVGSRTRRIKLGTHGALTVEEARNLAKAILGDVAKGEDPAEERATRRKSMTVAGLCEKYLAATEKGLILGKGGRPKKSTTLATDRGRILRHIKPLLGARLVKDLTQADISRFIRDVAGGKTATDTKTDRKRGRAIVTGGAGTAARTSGLLGGLLSFAVSEGVIPFNPARGVKRPAGSRRRRRLSAAEYRSLGLAIAAAEAEFETTQVVTATWLLALTGCRLGEIRGLKWSEIDEAGQCLRLEESKEGASVRPVGHKVIEILEKVDRKAGSVFVLPASRGDGSFGGLPRAWNRLMKIAKLLDVTPHTLRHSYASVAADLGYTESTIAALLGHAGNSVTSRYIHHIDSVLLAAADRTAREIFRYMSD